MYSQSIETPDAVDASCLIMPLVFFSSPTDPRMLNTIQRILLPPEKGTSSIGEKSGGVGGWNFDANLTFSSGKLRWAYVE